jgi:predicted phosphoribosyltransferase
MAFENRAEAGQMLARRLDKCRGQHPLVLAIPRGAVPMGKIVADALDGELDVVLVRKLRAPRNPELAIGSIDETGTVYLDPDTRDLGDQSYLETEQAPSWRRCGGGGRCTSLRDRLSMRPAALRSCSMMASPPDRR